MKDNLLAARQGLLDSRAKLAATKATIGFDGFLDEIIQARYPTHEWNLYVAQASDGDNWHQDSSRCSEILAQKILPLVRYYAYVQVAQTEQNLWDEYQVLDEQYAHFAMRKVLDASQIYPVFRELFKREGVAA